MHIDMTVVRKYEADYDINSIIQNVKLWRVDLLKVISPDATDRNEGKDPDD